MKGQSGMAKPDLIYSPDDGGYYFQLGDRVSRIYQSKTQALRAWRDGKVRLAA